MRVLLDTHAFLWWVLEDPRLSARAAEVIAEGDNEVWFSTASAWEMAIKTSIGRLRFGGEPEAFVTDQVALNGFRILRVELDHALHVQRLPVHHRDPFDRLLVAQCRLEGLSLVSRDRNFEAYGVEMVW